MNRKFASLAVSVLLCAASACAVSAATLPEGDVIATYKAADIAITLKYKSHSVMEPVFHGSFHDPWIVVKKGCNTIMRQQLVQKRDYSGINIVGPLVRKSTPRVIEVEYIPLADDGFEYSVTYTIQRRSGRIFRKNVKYDPPCTCLSTITTLACSDVIHSSCSRDTLVRLRYKGNPGTCEEGNPRLEIKRGDQSQLWMLECPPQWHNDSGCEIAGVIVTDINGDGLPDVYTALGGKETRSLVFEFLPAQKKFIERRCVWAAEEFPELTDLDGDGKLELVGNDRDFVEPFSQSYSIGYGPLLIKRLMDGKFVDVTNQFPTAIREHVNKLLKSCKAVGNVNCDADLAAVVADMTRLGEKEKAIDIVKILYSKQISSDFFHKLDRQLADSKYLEQHG